jgi:hypothetical protein
MRPGRRTPGASLYHQGRPAGLPPDRVPLRAQLPPNPGLRLTHETCRSGTPAGSETRAERENTALAEDV